MRIPKSSTLYGLFIAFLLLTVPSCQSTSSSSQNKKDAPVIEFIECQATPSDYSLGGKVYTNKQVTKLDRMTTVSFDFVRDCCLEFVGKWKLENDVLTLSYHPKSEIQEPCECKCTYSMKFHFNSKEYSWSRVRIRRGKYIDE